MYCDNYEVLVVEHFNFGPGLGEAVIVLVFKALHLVTATDRRRIDLILL